jgi:hypothetical protein
MADRKKVPTWAQPVHYVTATACGGAKKGHRLSRHLAEVTCRFCVGALKDVAERKRKGRAPSGHSDR